MSTFTLVYAVRPFFALLMLHARVLFAVTYRLSWQFVPGYTVVRNSGSMLRREMQYTLVLRIWFGWLLAAENSSIVGPPSGQAPVMHCNVSLDWSTRRHRPLMHSKHEKGGASLINSGPPVVEFINETSFYHTSESLHLVKKVWTFEMNSFGGIVFKCV